MAKANVLNDIDTGPLGERMKALVAELYPICRSITGDGVRETLHRIGERIPLSITEIPTGTPLLDWTAPKEWNIRGGYIEGPDGTRVVDFADHNLHVLGYSVPVDTTLPLEELKQHCYTRPEDPETIPYRTSYYKEQWGFCLAHNVLERFPEGIYRAVIDSELKDGALTYGECVLPGPGDEEVLISAHVCHPSLANDNLSGIALAVALAEQLRDIDRRYTYRFVFAPGTIGAIAWLAKNRDRVDRLRHGLVLACVGDAGELSYKRTREGYAAIDRAVELIFEETGAPHAVLGFSPYGYDERQYNSPGFKLPVGCFMRSGPGGYAEYHSSNDNLDIVQPEYLADSLEKLLRVVAVLEGNAAYVNTAPYGEPQLGRRGLYGAVGGQTDTKIFELAMLWVLNYSDGEHDLITIAEGSGIPFAVIREAADKLLEAGLLAGDDQEVAAAPVAADVEGGDDADFWDEFIEGSTEVDEEDVFKDFA